MRIDTIAIRTTAAGGRGTMCLRKGMVAYRYVIQLTL
jgi:hypothetical protein